MCSCALSLLLFSLPGLVLGWPDGAPCLRTVYDSMNPLEAVEHQGGLQLSEPPYSIYVDAQCYNPGQPVSLTLSANAGSEFKGFAMQPLVYEGTQVGSRRTGQFVRMDDNGSWQFQCFRIRDSITHSHDDRKAKMTLWWRGDRSGDTVQFVATVVQNLKRFWVKSVVSVPIPSCSLRPSIGAWSKGAPTPPPPTDNFKKETLEMFNPGSAAQLINDLTMIPQEPSGRTRPRVLSFDAFTLAPVFFRTRVGASPFAVATTVPPTFFRPRQQFKAFGQNSACRDSFSTSQCLTWLSFCATNPWMSQNCKATCRMC